MDDLIKREDVLKALGVFDDTDVYEVDPLILRLVKRIKNIRAVDAVAADKMAQMFYEFTGDDCPCNYNDNDEWLWNFCDGDHCPGEELECWKLFVKHYDERSAE